MNSFNINVYISKKNLHFYIVSEIGLKNEIQRNQISTRPWNKIKVLHFQNLKLNLVKRTSKEL